MFVCNSDGVYMPALRPPGTFDPSKDPRVLQVRTRRAKDLTALRRNFLPELGKTIKLRGTDYEYRAYCTKAQWGQALARMAEAIEYVKFKDTARDNDLHSLYLDIWGSILHFLSPRTRRYAKHSAPTGPATVGEADWTNYIPATGRSSLWSNDDWARAFSELEQDWDGGRK